MSQFKSNYSKAERIVLLFCSICLLCVYCLALEACGYVQNERKATACIGDDAECTASSFEEKEYEFESISFSQAIEDFEAGKSGIYYFGYPACPWCEEITPILKDAAESSGKKVYEICIRDENGERLYTDEDKERILPFLKEYMTENEETKDWTLYVPLLVRMENGIAVDGHVGTVEGHDAHQRKLTEEEKQEVERKVLNILLSDAERNKKG